MEENTSQPTQATIILRRRGAPKGNQNARRHGYYSKVHDVDRCATLAQLPPLAQLDAQIDWFAAKSRAVYQRTPLNSRVLHIAVNRIAQLQRSRSYVERLQRDPAFRRQVTDAFLEDGITVDLSWLIGNDGSQPETAKCSDVNVPLSSENSGTKAPKTRHISRSTSQTSQAQFMPKIGSVKNEIRENIKTIRI